LNWSQKINRNPNHYLLLNQFELGQDLHTMLPDGPGKPWCIMLAWFWA